MTPQDTTSMTPQDTTNMMPQDTTNIASQDITRHHKIPQSMTNKAPQDTTNKTPQETALHVVFVFFIRFLPHSIYTLIKLALKGLGKVVSIQLLPLKQYMKNASVAKKSLSVQKSRHKARRSPGGPISIQVMLLPSKIMTHNMTNDFSFHYCQWQWLRNDLCIWFHGELVSL